MVYPASSDFSSASTDRQFNVYLALSQYPVLAERIRARMRHELYERGIISPQLFEAEVRASAIQSQEQEGLINPFGEENRRYGNIVFLGCVSSLRIRPSPVISPLNYLNSWCGKF